ncbi:MAG: hypothetical protein QXO16_08490 [Archaeoglobaceae archaeon]
MQVDLSGNTIGRPTYYVYHDESIPNKGWLLIGLVLVRDCELDDVRRVLERCRQDEKYNGEIHFSDLPASFGGKWGAKARVARAWMHSYERTLKRNVFCSILCVHRSSPKFEPERFKREFHAYNRFTAMALKAAISWHLGPQKLRDLHIRFISDAKHRRTRPDKEMTDNFEEYIPCRAKLDAFLAQDEGRQYPSITMELELKDSRKEDLLQLCDLFLGATQAALVGNAQKKTKRELARYVVRWCKDLQKPLWEQTLDLHRKFNVWAFPDEEGKPYTNLEFALQCEDDQPPLQV